MKELLLMAATIMPEMEIVEKIHTLSAEILKGDASVKMKHELCMYSQMFMIKQMVGEDMSKMMTVMDDLNNIDKAQSLFKEKKN